MIFNYNIQVQVERESGKFASRDEVDAEIKSAIEEADPGEVGGVGADGDSTYIVIEWDVSSQ